MSTMNKLPENFTLKRYGLNVRLVDEQDADFIVELRTDEKLGRFIHATDDDTDKQKEWIKAYKTRESRGTDYYFMFERPAGVKIGVCRIYDIHENDFTIGSWVFSPDAPMGAAVLGDIITREIAFELFPDSVLLFDVKKENLNVNRYQAFYKPELISEDDDTYYYRCFRSNFEKYKQRFLRMLKL